MFITIEGGEGAGKTTLLNRLYDHLTASGTQVVKTREPGGTPLGEEIRRLILHAREYQLFNRTELFLFLADRAQHVEKVIKPALADGKIVLCDRFNDSTIAYQGLARGHPTDKLKALCQFASGDLTPDRTFFIDIDPPEGLRRVAENRGDTFDRIEQETINFHMKVREAFLTLAERDPNRFVVLNGNQTPDEVFNAAVASLPG